ncbi:hypothetical protein [Fischerella thermalis]|uniref:hypothetical protein n=1 Tax=Fischerella thermalis TaxID=372787 RepID=UPI00307E1052
MLTIYASLLGISFSPLPITNYQLPITSLRDSISIQANMILRYTTLPTIRVGIR